MYLKVLKIDLSKTVKMKEKAGQMEFHRQYRSDFDHLRKFGHAHADTLSSVLIGSLQINGGLAYAAIAAEHRNKFVRAHANCPITLEMFGHRVIGYIGQIWLQSVFYQKDNQLNISTLSLKCPYSFGFIEISRIQDQTDDDGLIFNAKA